ncbi:MAG: uracil-DNA glycosylase [Pirellulales bacterium]
MSTERTERLRRIVVGRLESLGQAGVLELPKIRKERAPLASKAPAAEAASPSVSEVLVSKFSSDATKPKKPGWKSEVGGTLFALPDAAPREISTAPTLEVLRQEVAACTRCDELASTRTQTVFGVGTPQARLCFIGEAPGADEDRQGEPFVGRAGQLLNKIIEACQLRREDVYICNILKCRPPGNRNPAPAESAHCRRFLERQLELVEPEFICCLGAIAAQNLLGTTQSIGKLRGKVHAYRGASVVCTYHPAYLLRNPEAKKDTWDDMKFLMREMGVEL